VPAEQRSTRLAQRRGGAFEDGAENPVGNVFGEAAEIEGEQRRAAHGVDVGERVGGGNPAEAARVVAHRGDEIGSGDQGAAVEKEDSGIVGRLRSDQHPLVAPGDAGERADQLRQVPRTYLGGSAARRGAGSQAELPPRPCHGGGLYPAASGAKAVSPRPGLSGGGSPSGRRLGEGVGGAGPD